MKYPEDYPDVDEFLDGVFNAIRHQVKEQKQVHPEDIMTTVAFVAEGIYQFISHMPATIGVTRIKY